MADINPQRLPTLVTAENKVRVGLVGAFIAVAMYLLSNHYHFFAPTLLPYTRYDRAIPFIPWTVWIYMSEYTYFFIVFALLKDLENLNRYLYSFFTLQLISVMIFWIWPTTFPRDQFPLPLDLDGITRSAFSSLRQTDTPANCAPSLHVSSVYLAALMFFNEQREKLGTFFLWGTLIAISTLTTKQHYIIDVVTGFGAAGLVFLIFQRTKFSARQSGSKTLRIVERAEP